MVLQWVPQGSNRGPQGIQGVPGPQGADGPAGPSGVTTLRGATDYDNTTAPVDGDAILWVPSGSKFAPRKVLTPDANGRVQRINMPLVFGLVREGSVSSFVTSDASSGAGNLVNIAVNGNITVNALTNPSDFQEIRHHFVAVGADRTVTFAGGFLPSGGAALGPYAIPRGKVLVTRSEYLGNRNDAADVDAPAWALLEAKLADSPPDIVSKPQRTVTAATTLTDTDSTLFVNSAASVTVTYPTAVGRAGKRFLVVKAGTGPLVLDPAGTETINGATTETISMQWGFREVESDGTNWIITGGKVDPVIANLTDIAAAGTLTINAAAATVYRARLMGATATLGVPTNPVDGDVINLELFPTVACSLAINAGIILTGGITTPIALPVNKLWSAALRYRAATNPVTVAAAWRLLASSPDN